MLVIVFTTLLCFNVKSQEFTRTNASGLQDVAVAPNGTIWACGTNGTIWYSTSNGNTWTQIEASGFKSIGANDNNIIACGDDETVWIANGSGASFQRTSATGFQDVVISPGGRMAGAGTNETIWTSSIQSPNNWSKAEASGFISVDNNDNNIVAAGSNGKIWIANINGTGWIETSASGFRQVSVAPSGVIYAVGTNGTLWSSHVSNRGQNWTQIGITDVRAVDLNDTKVVVVKNDETIWTGAIFQRVEGTCVMTRFNPSVHGFQFVNDFVTNFAGIDFGGLCGGMAYSALDYFNNNIPVPTLSSSPENGTPLREYIYNRQQNSTLDNLDKWGELSFNPFGSRTNEFFNWGLQGFNGGRLQELRAEIDAGRPVPLGLYKGGNGGFVMHHQVLAIGYDIGRYTGDLGQNQEDLRIYVYDSNYANQTMILRPNLSNQTYYYENDTACSWLTYFVDKKYRLASPPR